MTPSSLPATSSSISEVLVVGQSARLAAEACHHAGLRVWVLDFFGDADTRAVVEDWHPLPGKDDWTLDAEAVVERVSNWSQTHPEGVVLPVSGFEALPELVKKLSSIAHWCGVDADTLTKLKHPHSLQSLLAPWNLCVPPITFEARADWIVKSIGQSGGFPATHPHYWQARISGDTYSVLALANAQGVDTLSFHRVYSAPTEAAPHRFGGLVMTEAIPPGARDALRLATEVITTQVPLRGLFGIDIQWDGNSAWVLDVNPRPTAAVNLWPEDWQSHLFQRHLQCFLSADKKVFPAPSAFRGDLNPAFGIVYAGAALSIPADFQFPIDCHDRPVGPAHIAAGMPLCSIMVDDGGLGKLRRRIGDLRECLKPVAGQALLESL